MTDDLPPTGDEAQAQRFETVAPLVWGGLGLMAVLTAAAFLYASRGVDAPAHAVVVPAEAPNR